jgi:hypothetical protein
LIPKNVAIRCELARQKNEKREIVLMRLVIAAFVAWSALGLDFDRLNRPASEKAGNQVTAEADEVESPGLASSDHSKDGQATHLASPTDEPVEPAGLIAPEIERNFCEALKEAAEASNIPVPFFARLLWQESRFQSSEVSRVGAQGVAQFMPSTAAEVGLDDPFDPFKALPASAKYLRRLHNEFGNLGLAAAAYNAGSGRVQKWLSGQGKLPQETRTYVRRITGTPAENWVQEFKTVSLKLELPGDAPCEGVGGLSRTNELATVPVSLAPSISDMSRKAKAEAQRREIERLLALARSKRLEKTRAASRAKGGVDRGNGKSQSAASGVRHPAKTGGARGVRVASAINK